MGSTAVAKRRMTRQEKNVVAASSLGTVFEWYDFYLYVLLAAILAKQFFAGPDPRAGVIFALLALAAGFLGRPLGAIVFGRLGDLVGRKYTFLVTILIMGLATFMVGILPNYAAVGVAAPVSLIGLRLLQGLALGGEYGGAATFVAEHAPPGRRGAYTAWIQAAATLGLLLALLVTLGIRTAIGEAAFADWGWRIPFLLSIVLLAVAVWIRLSTNESPVFLKMKADGKTSRAPLKESFGEWKNLKMVILALVGLVAGQAVVWWAGHFYALIFLTQALQVDHATATILVAVSLLIGTPFFVIFGALSDRIGRKPIIMAGCLLAALTYVPVFGALARAANPDLAAAQAKTQVVVTADPQDCSFQGSPLAREIDFRSACDIAKRFLAQNSVSYQAVAGPGRQGASVKIGDRVITPPVGTVVNSKFDEASTKAIAAFKKEVAGTLQAAGYPTRADPAKVDTFRVIVILTYMVLLAAMVYGPLAAMLVEMFPTRIRYTSMSLPYHIGNGWFGGLLPATAFAIVAGTGNMYHGLWYPVGVAAATFVIGVLFIRDTQDVDLDADD
jgi:predicted MFS family arabinose efflux permease